MPFNQMKSYCDLLEIGYMDEPTRTASLKAIFKRDIEDNPNLRFKGKRVHPIKGEEPGVQLLFIHLTCEEVKLSNADGTTYPKRQFELNRAARLHWIKHHIDELKKENVEVFSVLERDQRKRKDVIKTYIYDKEQEYIIVLEPLRTGYDYYLLTAYHLNRPEGRKSIGKKLKQRLPDIH